MKQVTCMSGARGWQDKLQKVYNGDFKEFKEYCRNYNIHKRLGYVSMKAAWETNPTIQGSTNPEDIAIVYFHVIRTNKGFRIKETTELFCFDVKGSSACFLHKEGAQSHISTH